MKAIHPKVKDRGVIFISINVIRSDSDADLRAWREKNNIPTENWIIAQDTADLIVKYNAFKIPRLLVIDKEGYITYEHTGATSERNIKNAIEDAIEGDATAIKTRQYGIWILAFLAGIAMFFSPCAFPLLPGYMMLYFNVKEEATDKKKGYYRALKTGIIAALGIFTVILFYGILFSIASDLVGDIDWDFFAYVVIVVLFFFGILMLTEVQYGFLTDPIQRVKEELFSVFRKVGGDKATQAIEGMIGRATRSDFSFEKAKEEGQLGIYTFGVGYGGVSAGCHAPIFLAIFLAALGQGFFQALFIFVLFGVGMGIMVIVLTLLLATAKIRAVNWLRDNTLLIKKITGVSMILIAAILLLNHL